MHKKIQSENWSENFLGIMNTETKNLDIDQYITCTNEWRSAHNRKSIRNYIIAIVLFSAGLWFVWVSSWFWAVLLILLAANFNRQSADHILVSELMSSQRLLALMINKQNLEIAALKKN